ncbi:MAG: hypothetical protein ACRES2_05585 [Steroidobacteraceae bacterium]
MTMARWGTILVLAVLAAACGRDAGDARAQHEARVLGKADAAHSADALAAAAEEADFVAAVSSASTAPPVALKFRMQQPPRVGEPLQLDLELAQPPQQEISLLLVSLQPGDGLSVLSARSFEFRAPLPGATQRMNVTVRADAQAVLSLSATVLVDSGSTSVAYNFLIPLIAVPAGS